MTALGAMFPSKMHRHSDALLSDWAVTLYSAPLGPKSVFLCVCVCAFIVI